MPDEELFLTADLIRTAVLKKLRSGSLAPEAVPCRRDVIFRLIRKQRQGSVLTAQKLDFPEKFFPPGWDEVANVHGEGQRVHYPVTLRLTTRRSPVRYVRDGDKLKESQRAVQQFVTIQFVDLQTHI